MPNHPNRSRAASAARNPTPAEIRAAREGIQHTREWGITQAQTWCAEKMHSNPRTWQKYELGESRMHPALWNYFRLRAGLIALADIKTGDHCP